MLILVAIMMVVVLVMTAFSVDVAYMQLVRTELRTATDSASRAASATLSRTQSVTEARAAARRAAGQNTIAGEPLLLDDGDIVFGVARESGNGGLRFEPGGRRLNAVRINGRRTADSASGTVGLFFGGSVLGSNAFEPQITSTSTGLVRDIALVVDRSGSMKGQKIEDLKSGISIFLGVLEATPADERVSLTTYSTSGTKEVDMTSNLGQIRAVADQLRARGRTAIGKAMTIGSDSLVNDELSRQFAQKTIVLMTDGRENVAPFVDSVLSVPVDRGQVIHTITFGAGAEQSLMRRVADQTGGSHQHADDGADLEAAFRRIAKSLAVVLID